jgi:GT2 family glycosyltransferase
MSSAHSVSIIIPTGGRISSLTECIRSIQEWSLENEIIVIGDKKDEHTRRVLFDAFPSIRYLESKEPSAVVKRNLGIAHASNDILVFVDDDVVVNGTWMENLTRHFRDESVGGVGGRVEIPGIRRGTSSYKTGVIEDGFIIGNWNPAAVQPFEVQHLLGCNMSFRKAPVMKVGGFDNFFRACNFREETDLCLRIGLLGYRLIFDPDANLVHKALGRKSQGSRWIYYYIRNTIYIYLKYQQRRSRSVPRFLRFLLFPPQGYSALSGVKVRITPCAPLVAASAMFAGFLGYFTHKER